MTPREEAAFAAALMVAIVAFAAAWLIWGLFHRGVRK